MFFEPKGPGAYNGFLHTGLKWDNLELVIEKRFFDPGAECLYQRRSQDIPDIDLVGN